MVKVPTDDEFGPLLSLVVLLLVLCIAFLVVTLPFSSVLHMDAGVVAGVISALGTVLGAVLYSRGRREDR